MVKIALDMMGGDLGLEATVPGLIHFLSRSSNDVFFTLFGNKDLIVSKLDKAGTVYKDRFSIIDTKDNVISSSEKPTIAVRKGRGSSMFEAIQHVANGFSDAVVSSGNTGAYMALSKLILKMIDSLERPALVSLIPNKKGKCVMLDLGANTECSAMKLVQFAILGQAMARVLLKIDNPSIGLLNIGTEKQKGTKALIEAYNQLESSDNFNFIGFVEGTDITKGTSDVVVTDGFSGNVSLKTLEGTIKFFSFLLKKEIKASFWAKIGFLFCSGAIKAVKDYLNPSVYNGAPLLGLNKIAVKSHGGSDYIGFSNAIRNAVEFTEADFIARIKTSLSTIANTPTEK